MKNETTLTGSLTDLARLDALADEEIDFSELPEVTAEMFARAVVRRGLEPRKKVELTIRIDDDVLKWFRQPGRGYQSRMNALLRAYMEAHQARPGPPRGQA
jgi:uncharacterized protein (DUF4415 family)